ncbi:MAG: type II toxin-antitoxin system RelE/ParE family toxin [Deltaproteobacteria bacterium]|nr:type II toxin-antitoxin system RelE/ParE family toxin [Deltaproteobacteria bacterium]
MSDYVLTPLAKADIFEIWSYIARDNEEAADRVESAIYDACAEAAQAPLRGHTRPDLTPRPFVSGHSTVIQTMPSSTGRVIGVGSRRPVEIRSCCPLRLFPGPAQWPAQRTRMPGSAVAEKDTLEPWPHYRALAFACFQAGEGPGDHGALGAASPEGIARRF